MLSLIGSGTRWIDRGSAIDRNSPPTVGWRTRSAVAAGVLAAAALAAAECPPLGAPLRFADGFVLPAGVAFRGDGSLLVADSAAGEVVQFDRGGVLVDRLEAALPWSEPAGVASLADGGFLVVDRRAGRLDRFDAEGAWAETLRASAAWSPSAVAAAGDRIAVLDGDRETLEILSADGSLRARLGPQAGSMRRWRRPVGVALAADGRIFVSDGDGHRIVVLGPEGEEIATFGERGPYPGLLHEPAGLAIRGDCLFVADRLNHRVSVFDLEGRFRGQWGLHAVRPRAADGEVHYPQAVAIAPDGSQAAVAEPFERRVQWFGPDPEPAAAAAAIAPARDGVMSHFGRGLAIGGDLLAMWEPESASVVLFDWRRSLPIHVTTFGGPTGRGRAAPDRFGRIEAIAIDPQRQRIMVADAGAQRLAFFDLDRDPEGEIRFDPFMGRLAGTVDLRRIAASRAALAEGFDASRPIEPVDAIATREGAILLLDRGEGVVLVVAPQPRESGEALPSELVSIWGDRGAAGGRFDRASAMATLPDGAIAVLDAGGITMLGLDGTRRGWIPRPAAIADAAGLGEGLAAVASPQGTLLIASDPRRDRLVAIDAAGAVVGEVGRRGGEDGELWLPQAVRGRGDGSVIVVDAGNHRAQGFRLPVDEEAGGSGWTITFGLGRAYTRPRGAIAP